MPCVLTGASRMDSIFYDLPFTTEPGRVFTPRPATEELVDAVIARVGDDAVRIADVGTGSGAVGIAVAVHRPTVEVVATDLCAPVHLGDDLGATDGPLVCSEHVAFNDHHNQSRRLRQHRPRHGVALVFQLGS